MAMTPRWYGPTCLRFSCRIHDIRCVLDEKGAWHLARLVGAMRHADPDTPVILEWDLTGRTPWPSCVPDKLDILHGDEDTVVGSFPAELLAALSAYTYNATGPLYEP